MLFLATTDKTIYNGGRNMQQIKLNRNYKDRLFRLAFQEKKDLLDLYNAVSGRQYTNPDDIDHYHARGCDLSGE